MTLLSKITAEAINKMPKELETLTIDYLQDHASLYGSDYDQYLDESTQIARLCAQRDAMRAELREATEATDDPAVNNLRTLPESIRLLRAERDALQQILFRAEAERDELLKALTRYVDHFGDPLKCARAAIAKAIGERNDTI